MKYLFLTFIIFSFGFSNTTLCFKNGYNDFATIEEQKFFGGECKGKNSINDMKSKGWKIEDIKVVQKDELFNFVYILRESKSKIKPNSIDSINSKNTKIDYKKVAKIIEKKEEDEKIVLQLEEGKRLYTKNCQECHGVYGEIEYQTSRAISKLSLEESLEIMRAYSWDEYDRGFAFIMKAYADLTTPDRMKSIHKYLQSINK